MADSGDYMEETLSIDSDFEPIDIQCVEVYECPSDVEPQDLEDHFNDTYKFENIDEDCHKLWNPTTETYILQFIAADAEVILRNHVQKLGEGQVIKVRPYPIQDTKFVKVACEQDVTPWLIKKYLKLSQSDYVKAINQSKSIYLVECKDAIEAKRLFKEANVTIGKYGTADLLPYYPDEAGDYDESAAGASSYDHSGSQTFSRSGLECSTASNTSTPPSYETYAPPLQSSTMSSRQRNPMQRLSKDDKRDRSLSPLPQENDEIKPTVFLVRNVIYQNGFGLCCWCKALFGVWPSSIQFSSPDKEMAVVKLPSAPSQDGWEQELKAKPFRYYGMTLRVEEIPPCTSIQVTVYDKDGIDRDALLGRGLTTNPDNLSSVNIEEIKDGDKWIYIMHYRSAEEARDNLQAPERELTGKRLRVQEYYDGMGRCADNSVYITPPDLAQQYEPKNEDPVVVVSGVRKDQRDVIKDIMSNEQESGGDPKIKLFTTKSSASSHGLVDITITYRDSRVCTRVFQHHRQNGITLDGTKLNIQVTPPTVTESDDLHSVELSTSNPNTDPDILQFYLAALAENPVTQLVFNKTNQCHAQATFDDKLDFRKLYNLHMSARHLIDADLEIRSAKKITDLVASGKDLTKEGLRAQISSILVNAGHEKPSVNIETTIIDTGSRHHTIRLSSFEERECIQEQNLRKCDKLLPYSDHIGSEFGDSGCYIRRISLTNIYTNDDLKQIVYERVLLADADLRSGVQGVNVTAHRDGDIASPTIITVTMAKTGNFRSYLHLVSHLGSFIDKEVEQRGVREYSLEIIDAVKFKFIRLLKSRAHDIDGYEVQEDPELPVFRIFCTDKIFTELKLKLQGLRRDTEHAGTKIIPLHNPLKVIFLRESGFLDKLKTNYNLWAVDVVGEDSIELQGHNDNIHQAANAAYAVIVKVHHRELPRTPEFLVVKQQPAYTDLDSNPNLVINFDLNGKVTLISDDKTLVDQSYSRLSEVYFDESSVSLDEEQSRYLETSNEEWMKFIEGIDGLFYHEIVPKHRNLHLIGLSSSKPQIERAIEKFLDQHVIKTIAAGYVCDKNVMKFIQTNDSQQRKLCGLETQHGVEIIISGSGFLIAGPKTQNQHVAVLLKQQHDSVQQGEHQVSKLADIQYIRETADFLDVIGREQDSLLVKRSSTFNTSAHKDSLFSVTFPSGSVCEVRKGDITAVTDCDAVVNPASETLRLGGGVAGAIRTKGGSIIERECKAFLRDQGREQLVPAEVMSTSAGSLPCKRVIHAVGPRWRSSAATDCKRSLLYCVTNCFDQLKDDGLRTIAIPPISTGIFAFPIELAAPVIIEAIIARERQGKLPARVVLIDNKDDSLSLYRMALQESGFGQLPTREEDIASGTYPTYEEAVDHVYKAIDEDIAATLGAAAPIANSGSAMKVTDRSVTCQNGTVISIKEGDLTRQKKAVWVNSSLAPDCQLSKSGLGKAMIKAAGNQAGALSIKCYSYRGKVREGGIIRTDSYNNLCTSIVHCICHQKFQGKQTLMRIVDDCLGESEGNSAIVFPALGTGGLDYPKAQVAEAMLDAMLDYTSRNPMTSITDITIMVFPSDKPVLKEFEKRLQVMAGQMTKPGDSQLLQQQQDNDTEFTCGHRTLRILQGDIITHNAQAIVCTTDASFSRGGILYEKLKQTCPQLHNVTKLQGGNVAAYNASTVMSAHWDTVLLMSTPTIKLDHCWAERITQCLEYCVKNGKKSIAFPAIATGNPQQGAEDTAGLVLKTVAKFLRKQEYDSRCCLDRIDIVIYQPQHVKAYKDALKKVKGPKTKNALQRAVGAVAHKFTFATLEEPAQPESLEEDPSYASAEPVYVDIYANKQTDIENVKAVLQQKLAGAKKTIRWSQDYKGTVKLVHKLSQVQVQRLQTLAKKNGVEIDICLDRGRSDIVMTGLPQTLHNKMIAPITSELNKAQENEHSQYAARLKQNTVQWSYQNEDGTWEDFDVNINQELEMNFEGNSHAQFKLCEVSRKTNQQIKLDGADGGCIESPTGQHVAKLRRHDKTKGRIGPFWEPALNMIKMIPLSEDTIEYQIAVGDFMSTIDTRFHGGCKSQINADQVRILEIFRVQNPTTYEHYMVSLETVADNRGRSQSEIELAPVYHGTSQESVKPIVESNNKSFERGFSSANIGAKLGNGMYFASNSGYSCEGDQYAKPNAEGERFVIQCRVILGDFCQGRQGVTVPDLKPNSSTDRYDSVCDVAEGKPSIIVSFNDTYVYPEYVIKFRRTR